MGVVKIQTGLRLDEQTYDKLKILAFRENRSINNMAEYIIKCYLDDFEEKNGRIDLPVDEQLSTRD